MGRDGTGRRDGKSKLGKKMENFSNEARRRDDGRRWQIAADTRRAALLSRRLARKAREEVRPTPTARKKREGGREGGREPTN